MHILLMGQSAEHAGQLREKLAVDAEIETAPTGIEPDSLRERLSRADVLVSMRFDGTLPPAPRLRLLQLPGAGLDLVDLEAVPAGCAVCNVYEHEIPIAEYVMVAMLEWVISYRDMTDAFSRESWTRLCFARPPHGELAGKTLGIVGFGHIGKAIARRARSFEMRVLATGRTARAPEEGAEWIGGTEDLDRLLRDSDFVVLACPLNAETRGLIGAPQLAQMKPSAVLINVARGDVVVQDALFAALKDRRIGGAVLDVWYRYPTSPDAPVPPADYPFETLPNVHATAHVSGWTDGLFERRWSFIAANIGRFARGEPLQNLIRPPVAG